MIDIPNINVLYKIPPTNTSTSTEFMLIKFSINNKNMEDGTIILNIKFVGKSIIMDTLKYFATNLSKNKIRPM